jgi:RHS repeat-associated protein
MDASGTMVVEDRFYPYGETRFTTGSMYTDKLFTGQREMTGLGIYHYGARFYSPKLGRFLSADTIVPDQFNPQDLNRFSYVRNNPLRYTDPTGHMVANDDDDCYGCTLPSSPIPTPKPSSSSNNGGNNDNPDIFVPVTNISGPYIYIPVNYGGGPNIFVPIPGDGGGPLIFVPVSNNSGLETFDPAPQWNNILFSKKPNNKDKDSARLRPLTKDDLDILEGAGFNIHDLKGKGSSKYNLFKDNKGNVYQKNYDGSGEADPLNINLNNPGSA